MDQLKIGRFIAEQRKEKGLTQMQLAEMLGITDKAVSKWERGIAMPDVSMMPELCGILGISINELFNGEKISMEHNDKKNEQLLLDMAKELEQKNQTVRIAMWVIMTVCLIAFIGGTLLISLLMPEGVWQLVAIIALCIVFILPCFYALKLEVSVGTYKCKKCGHEIKPTYTQALMAMHMGTTRYLKCPACNKRTWCKKVWKK